MKHRNPNLFRASYSTLSAWASGNIDLAVAMYFDLPIERSLAQETGMAGGRAYHDSFRQETARTQCLPQLFGGHKLNNPVIETKTIIPMPGVPWLEFVIYPDVREDKRLIDYKTGSMTASSEAAKIQGGMYALGELLLGNKIEIFDVYHYSPIWKEQSFARRWVTPTYLKEAETFIKTNSYDMHKYLIKNGLYQQYCK